MKIALACDQFVVFDDVLEAIQLEELWSHVQTLRFRPVDLGAHGAWLPDDGRPMTGPAVVAWLDPSRAIPDSKLTPFPTGTPLDTLVERLLDEAPGLVAWVGAPVEEWAALTAIAWLYPLGSALSWHTDSQMYSGAFAFYVHPAWDAHWGGELVFADPSAGLRASARVERSVLSERIAERGIGIHVMPRPNRLVVLAAGHPHRIARVEPAAGDRVRASISGFFLRTQALAALDRS